MTTVILAVTLGTLLLGVAGIVVLHRDRERARGLDAAIGVHGDPAGGRILDRVEHGLVSLGRVKRFQARLLAAGLSWPAFRVLLVLTLVILIVLVLGRPLVGRIASVVVALLVFPVFSRWLNHRGAKRAERFIAQLPDVARVLANGSSAGLSMRRCLAMAASETQEPAAEEFGRVVNQLDLGWPVERALGDLGERLPSREVNVLVRTIVIQQRAGGELVRALQDIATSLEERKELRREVSTVILGSSVSGYAVVLIGLGSVVLMNLFKPGILDLIAASFLGQVALVVSATLFVIGFFLMKFVSRVDV